MARRKDSGIDLLAALPWPVGVALGVAGYATVRWGVPAFLSGNGGPIGSALGRELGKGTSAMLAIVVLVLCWIGAAASFFASRRRRRLLETQTGLESLAALGWKEFEMLVGEAFRRQGYAVEETGLGGADGGIDLRLTRAGKRYLVQCKHWKTRSVNVSTVREMWGLVSHHGVDGVKIVTAGQYTRDAEAFATGKAIELIGGERLLEMVRAAQVGPSERATSAPRAKVEPTLAPQSEAAAEPTCPRCSAPMALRRKRADDATFWGCSRFPACRGTRPV